MKKSYNEYGIESNPSTAKAYEDWRNSVSIIRGDTKSKEVDKLIQWFINKDKEYKFSLLERLALAWWTFKSGYKLVLKLKMMATFENEIKITDKNRLQELAGIGGEKYDV